MKEKVLKSLAKLNTPEDVDYLEQKIKKSSKINRRTVAGRELTEELLNACNTRAREIIQENNILPFV